MAFPVLMTGILAVLVIVEPQYGTDRDLIAFFGVCFWIDGPEQT
jgi:hypothetical protein